MTPPSSAVANASRSIASWVTLVEVCGQVCPHACAWRPSSTRLQSVDTDFVVMLTGGLRSWPRGGVGRGLVEVEVAAAVGPARVELGHPLLRVADADVVGGFGGGALDLALEHDALAVGAVADRSDDDDRVGVAAGGERRVVGVVEQRDLVPGARRR